MSSMKISFYVDKTFIWQYVLENMLNYAANKEETTLQNRAAQPGKRRHYRKFFRSGAGKNFCQIERRFHDIEI